jgi:hypothetical protein
MTKNNSKSIPKIKVLIDTSPLENAHADRGVGSQCQQDSLIFAGSILLE